MLSQLHTSDTRLRVISALIILQLVRRKIDRNTKLRSCRESRVTVKILNNQILRLKVKIRLARLNLKTIILKKLNKSMKIGGS